MNFLYPTPDSVNLLSEACATGVPVLCHFEKPLRGKLAHFYRDLLEAGRVRPMKLDYQGWEVQPLREIEAVAARARAHLVSGEERGKGRRTGPHSGVVPDPRGTGKAARNPATTRDSGQQKTGLEGRFLSTYWWRTGIFI